MLDRCGQGLFRRLKQYKNTGVAEGLAKDNSFFDRRDAEEGKAFMERAQCEGYGSQSVSVRFDDRHYDAAVGHSVANECEVVGVGVEINGEAGRVQAAHFCTPRSRVRQFERAN